MSARPVIRLLAQLDDYGTLSDAAAGTASLRTLGTGAAQAAAGNHGHAASAITSGVLAMARLATGTPDGTKFVRDDGTLVTPPAADLSTAPILAPATAARNTVVPGADVAALTLKSLNAAPAANTDLQEWQQSNGTVFGFVSDVGRSNLGTITGTKKRAYLVPRNVTNDVGLYMESGTAASSCIDLVSTRNPDGLGNGVHADKVIRFFNPTATFWDPQDPQAYFTGTGAYRTQRDVVISGYPSGSGDTFQILRASGDPFMLSVWSDVNGPGVQVRANADAASYNFSSLDSDANHTFAVLKDGVLKWGQTGGVGTTTFAQLDTSLYRPSGLPNTLRTDGDFYLANNKTLLSVKAAGGNRKLIGLASTDEITLGQAAGGLGMKLWATTYTFINNADTLAVLTIGATTLTLGEAVNLVAGTTTGTKIGTATTQKLGFYDATPIVQPPSTTDLRQALINLGLYATGGATPLNLNGGVLAAGATTTQPATDVIPLTVRNHSGNTAKSVQVFDGNSTEMFYLKAPNEFWMVGSAVFKTSGGMSFEPAAGNMFFKQPFGVQMEWTTGGSLTFTNGTAITLSNSQNLVLGTGAGTKIGTGTTQKLALWNATPVVQPSAIANASGGAIIDIEARAQLNLLLAAMRTIGAIAT